MLTLKLCERNMILTDWLCSTWNSSQIIDDIIERSALFNILLQDWDTVSDLYLNYEVLHLQIVKQTVEINLVHCLLILRHEINGNNKIIPNQYHK